MITLHGFGPNIGLPDASPFVLKIDAFLRLAGIPFESVPGVGNVRKAPKGKLPFITDDGEVISDSTFIIEHLQKKHNINLDQHLDDTQRAIAFLLRATLEEKIYWCSLYYRWADDAGWAQTKEAFFGELPLVAKSFVPLLVRRSLRKALHEQGTGRHSPGEILNITRECLQSISAIVGDGPFLFGDTPCTTDATLYGFLAQLTLADIDTPVNTMANSYPNLKAYSERFKARYY